MNNFLYHGSSTSHLKVLRPNISLELKPRLYATEDYYYALVRSGRQLDLIREEYYGLDKPFELCECYPGAFEQMFDAPGSIYTVPKSGFRMNPNDPDEYISDDYAYPVGEMWHNSALRIMREHPERFKLIFYGTPEWREYWKNVRGGLDGYLERKHERKNKMMKLRTTQPNVAELNTVKLNTIKLNTIEPNKIVW